eukprot:gnl/MRDRNA2_/MRDRNA2_20852_c0_seq1.p1 gnl/MRDRNA2_/MRDRNA2_20852_c0~~gnl/MRDRNA2_/MRDRNA2_20852_c0_seq1.p1  ORF type:complete len:406 (+),score=43.31 gnl/MRDRNA2_/MRDRNA2_20852_c0_seq1:169-1386(+)
MVLSTPAQSQDTRSGSRLCICLIFVEIVFLGLIFLVQDDLGGGGGQPDIESSSNADSPMLGESHPAESTVNPEASEGISHPSCAPLGPLVSITCPGCRSQEPPQVLPPSTDQSGHWLHASSLRMHKDGIDKWMPRVQRRSQQNGKRNLSFVGEWVLASDLHRGAIKVYEKEYVVLTAATHGNDLFWKRVTKNEWERDFLQWIPKYVNGDVAVVDFGSWIGPTVLAFAAQTRQQVIGIEADFSAFATLSANIMLNPELKDHVVVKQMCIATSRGSLVMSTGAPGSSSTRVGQCTCSDRYHWEVPCQTLPELVHCHGLDDTKLAIKIDVEGYERSLLPALVPWLQERKRQGLMPTIFLSLHKYPNSTEEETFFRHFSGMFNNYSQGGSYMSKGRRMELPHLLVGDTI